MKTIYISGPITVNKTGKPREGWQQDFLDAEERLRRMGFGVINPVEIARETEDEWRQQKELQSAVTGWSGRQAARMDDMPSHGTYLTACLQVMNTEHLAGRLHGMYVIGSDHDPYAKQRCYYSHGVQMELHMAKALGIPIFSLFYDGNEIDINLLPVKDGKRLLDNGKFGKENWSDKL